ncbi:MAG: M50 family metallopeptidase [Anaerolineae bacterium]|nr:M50 family metallopeptidase [Anaerolineae bacterium]
MMTEPPLRRRLWIVLLALVVVFILWNVPQFDAVLTPFRLFVTFVHEAGHGTAALLTGGEFAGFVVHDNGSGQATTRGGSLLAILPAGYLGAALFGAVLFTLANRLHYTRPVSILLGLGLIVFSILFARASLLALIVGLAFGTVLIGLGWRANLGVNTFVLNVLAILTGLNAVFDVWYLVGDSSASLGTIRNDAAAFSQAVAPLVPAAVWAFLWSVLAVLMLGIAIWYSLVRPIRQRLNGG